MAITGFLVHGICADGSALALDALGSAFPQFLGSTPPVMCNLSAQSFIAPSTFSQTISCHDLTGAAQYIFVHPISLIQCDPTISTTPFFDGMTMGWGVVSAMAAAAAIIFIKKAFFR